MPFPAWPAAWLGMIVACAGGRGLPLLVQAVERGDEIADIVAPLAARHAGAVVEELIAAIEADGKNRGQLCWMLRGAVAGSDPGFRAWLSRFAVRRWEIEVERERAEFASASGAWPAVLLLLADLRHPDVPRFVKTGRALCRGYTGKWYRNMLSGLASGSDGSLEDWLVDWKLMAAEVEQMLLSELLRSLDVAVYESVLRVRTQGGRLLFSCPHADWPKDLGEIVWHALHGASPRETP